MMVAFKAVALAMAVASFILALLQAAQTQICIMLLSVGLLALALVSFMPSKE